MYRRIAVAVISTALMTGCSAQTRVDISPNPQVSTAPLSSRNSSAPTPRVTLEPVPPVTATEPQEPLPEPAPPAADQLQNVTPQLLTLNIAGYGDQPEIDACIGWIILTRYESNGIQPTIAEHNNCGGAAILNLPIGSRLELTGGGLDGLYEIVDSRDAPQNGTTLDIQGMAGEILAQSCYFNSAYMRFIGLVKVG
ncbi:hypothetical protein [Aurantimicrobium minutum]|uniref:hypothetical protein n=1 Tax=Aurantimicrobium minutum TaxID=708131 RepID=UPI00247456E2|nr:hypothetical protein [Aurantimicrobium minutum]MDH6422828.1 hypothetical protein [Aurantimicrobium minutum]